MRMCPKLIEMAGWIEISSDDDYAATNGND
jgi:hypothetical protein